MAQNDCVDYPNENAKRVLESTLINMGYKDFKVDLTMASRKGDNYLGLIYRVSVWGKKNVDGKKSRLSLILKSTPNYCRDKFPMKIVYDREIYSYNILLPILATIQDEWKIPESEKFPFIKVYATDSTNCEEVLIMEDLKEDNFVIANRKESLTYDHVMLVMRHLAHFHALSFKLKQDNIDKFNEMVGNLNQGEELNDFFKTFIDLSVSKAVNALDNDNEKEKLKQFQEDAYSVYRNYLMGDIVQPYTVFCHGDCWINNIMFQYENGKPINMRMVDWQLIKQTSPVADLFNFIFSGTDERVRENFHEFLDHYYDTLKISLHRLDCDVAVCYPRNVFEKHVQQYLPFGLIIGCITAPAHMSEGDDIPDLEEAFKKDNEDYSKFMDWKNEESKKKYECRLRGIVSDVVKLGGL